MSWLALILCILAYSCMVVASWFRHHEACRPVDYGEQRGNRFDETA